MFAQEVQETPKAISTVAVALGTSQKTLLLKKPQTFDTGFRGSKLNATESPSVRTSLRRLKKCCKLPREGKNLTVLPNCGASESQGSAQQDIQKGATSDTVVLAVTNSCLIGPEASSNRREVRSGFKSSQPPLAGKVTEVTQISKQNLLRPLS